MSGPWEPVTTTEFVARVRRLGRGLAAVGIETGDAVAIMAATRYEWAVAEMACWFAGAVVVPVYDTSAGVQVEAIVADAGVRLGLAGNAEQAGLLRRALARPRPGGTRGVDVGCRPRPRSGRPRTARRGPSPIRNWRNAVPWRAPTRWPRSSTRRERPPLHGGALLTHGNFVHQVLNVAAAYTEVVKPDGNTIIFLPLAHVLARALQLVCLAKGMRIAHLADPREVVPALAVLRPTFLVVVPRVLQKVQAAAAAAAGRKRLGPVWAAAQSTAVAWGGFLERRQDDPSIRPSLWLAVRRRVFGEAVLRPAPGAVGWPDRVHPRRRGGARRRPVPVLPGDRRPGGRGLRAHRDHRSADGEPARGHPSGERGGSAPRHHGAHRCRRRGAREGDRASSPATATPRRTRRPSPTGSSVPAISASSTSSVGSPCADGARTSSSPPAARPSPPAGWEGSVEQNPLVAHAVLVGEGKPYLGGLILLDPESVSAWGRARRTRSTDPAERPGGWRAGTGRRLPPAGGDRTGRAGGECASGTLRTGQALLGAARRPEREGGAWSLPRSS